MPEEIGESQAPQKTEEEQTTQEGDGTTAEMPEEAEEETTQAGGGAMNLLSPEGVVMMPLAIIIDLIGIIIVCFGLDDFGITDIIGITLIGAWMFLRSGATPEKRPSPEKKPPIKGAKGAEKAVEKSFLKRFGLVALAELIPYLGALPWWTITVYKELTES